MCTSFQIKVKLLNFFFFSTKNAYLCIQRMYYDKPIDQSTKLNFLKEGQNKYIHRSALPINALH